MSWVSAARLLERTQPQLSFRSRRRCGHCRNFRRRSLSAVDLWRWSDFELEYSRAAEFHSGLQFGDDDEELPLEQLKFVVSEVFVNRWYGYCKCQVFLESPTCGGFGTKSQGTPCISRINNVSERFVVPVFGLSDRCAPKVCLRLSQPDPFSRAVSPLPSLFPRRQSTMFRCQHLEQAGFC